MDRPVFSVTELNNYVKACLESNPALQRVCVSGEISNYKLYPSGHHYFSLKDAEGSLNCVMFKGSAASLRFRPENGLTVIATGRVSVYPRDGKYQLIVGAMMPAGAGDLQLAFEQLKTKLAAEGLFDEGRKKPLPLFPKKIAVVTSPVGAAVRDVIRILGARWPMADVLVVPTRVQGAEAPAEICAAINYVNQYELADVIITGRGGGSAEDLWCFNDERVARTIAASRIPVISAVGHEPDVAISDYVADRRASTPSNGAEICVPDRSEVAAAVNSLFARAGGAMSVRLENCRRRLSAVSERKVLKDPGETLYLRRLDVDRLGDRLVSSAAYAVDSKKGRLASLASALDAMSPLKVMSRGYAAVTAASGTGICSVSEVIPGDSLNVILSDGRISCTARAVEKTAKNGK